MRSFQKIILVFIGILIIIMGILIIDNYTSEDNLFSESKAINLDDTSVQGIRLTSKELKSSDSYNFKITNYMNDKINKKIINYSIEIKSSRGLSPKLFKGSKKENILNDSKTNNFILNNETKQDEIYKLTYDNKKIDKNDYIEIQIKAWEE